MYEVGNAPASLTPATIFAQSLATGAMADRVAAADTADSGRAAAEWAHTPGFEDRLGMPDTMTAPKVVAVVA